MIQIVKYWRLAACLLVPGSSLVSCEKKEGVVDKAGEAGRQARSRSRPVVPDNSRDSFRSLAQKHSLRSNTDRSNYRASTSSASDEELVDAVKEIYQLGSESPQYRERLNILLSEIIRRGLPQIGDLVRELPPGRDSADLVSAACNDVQFKSPSDVRRLLDNLSSGEVKEAVLAAAWKRLAGDIRSGAVNVAISFEDLKEIKQSGMNDSDLIAVFRTPYEQGVVGVSDIDTLMPNMTSGSMVDLLNVLSFEDASNLVGAKISAVGKLDRESKMYLGQVIGSYGSVKPENALKWSATLPDDARDYAQAIVYAEQAEKNPRWVEGQLSKLEDGSRQRDLALLGMVKRSLAMKDDPSKWIDQITNPDLRKKVTK